MSTDHIATLFHMGFGAIFAGYLALYARNRPAAVHTVLINALYVTRWATILLGAYLATGSAWGAGLFTAALVLAFEVMRRLAGHLRAASRPPRDDRPLDDRL